MMIVVIRPTWNKMLSVDLIFEVSLRNFCLFEFLRLNFNAARTSKPYHFRLVKMLRMVLSLF